MNASGAGKFECRAPYSTTCRQKGKARMQPGIHARRLARVVGVAAVLIAGVASAADVYVMISAGFYSVYSEKGGLVRPDSKTELARSLIGMVVRAGTEKPDIGSVEAFRNTLLAAKSIAYSDSGSGTYLSGTLFAKLSSRNRSQARAGKCAGPRRANRWPRSSHAARRKSDFSRSAS